MHKSYSSIAEQYKKMYTAAAASISYIATSNRQYYQNIDLCVLVVYSRIHSNTHFLQKTSTHVRDETSIRSLHLWMLFNFLEAHLLLVENSVGEMDILFGGGGTSIWTVAFISFASVYISYEYGCCWCVCCLGVQMHAKREPKTPQVNWFKYI